MEETEVREELDESATDAEIVIDAETLTETESALDSMLEESQEVDNEMTNFTAPLSDIEHGHGFVKGAEGQHDLRERWNVRDEFIANNMYSMPNDHLAIHEMVERRAEFEASDEAVFEDTSNTDSHRWESIESFAKSNRAPVPDHARQKLRRIINN